MSSPSLWTRLLGALGRAPPEAAPGSQEAAVEIICLANSRKRGGRCLAGLRTDGGGWVRPVSAQPDGELQPSHHQFQGGEARVLDKLRVDLAKPLPKPHQPENWLLEGRWYNPWHKACRRVGRPDASDVTPLLLASLTPGPALLGCRNDRAPYSGFLTTPAGASLALVRPQGLQWQVKTGGTGKRQTRAVFRLEGAMYNLALTDPVWEQKLGNLPLGLHPGSVAGFHGDDDVLLTISLGEPFPPSNCCYKLVAAVIVLSGMREETSGRAEDQAAVTIP